MVKRAAHPMQGESPKSRVTDSKAYNSTMKKGEDAKDTANHKYNSAKASADKNKDGSSFYHSAKDKAYSAKDTASHKAHETKDKVQDHAEDAEDESLSKGDKAKDKVRPFAAPSSMDPPDRWSLHISMTWQCALLS